MQGLTRHPSLAQRAMESAAIARIYESRLWRRSRIATLALGISFEREQQLIGRAARLSPGDSLLDVACGPGIYARPFARQVAPGLVVGLDLSPAMLGHARRRARAAGLENLALVRGDALRLPFAGGRFDAVNCCGALHLFPDADLALREVHRVLKPGGRFTVAAFRRDPVGGRPSAARSAGASWASTRSPRRSWRHASAQPAWARSRATTPARNG